MPRHRILILGAPASGRRWLAERIRALTGIEPLDTTGADPARHEWLGIADDASRAAALLPRADLVVVVHTPRWLRALRLLMRRLGGGGGREPGAPPLARQLARNRRFESEELPALTALVESHGVPHLRCASSEDVRAVLECVFGIHESLGHDAAGPPGTRRHAGA